MCTLILVYLFIAVYCFAVMPPDIQDNQCSDATCGPGEFFNCTCQPCPSGYFNPNRTHRDNACKLHRTDEGCTLLKNGTNETDNKWNCTTPAVQLLQTSTQLHVASTQNGSLSSSQETSQYLVIILSTLFVLVIGICFVAFLIWCCRRRRHQDEPGEQAQELVSTGS